MPFSVREFIQTLHLLHIVASPSLPIALPQSGGFDMLQQMLLSPALRGQTVAPGVIRLLPSLRQVRAYGFGSHVSDNDPGRFALGGPACQAVATKWC
jgi:hypothetical protein